MFGKKTENALEIFKNQKMTKDIFHETITAKNLISCFGSFPNRKGLRVY